MTALGMVHTLSESGGFFGPAGLRMTRLRLRPPWTEIIVTLSKAKGLPQFAQAFRLLGFLPLFCERQVLIDKLIEFAIQHVVRTV